MFRYKEYKRTIVIAVTVILLCLVSIVGVTLALFTNDVNDGTIGINATAGKLDVDIVDTTDAMNTLVDQYLDFTTKDGQVETVLFEPGATFYTEGFRILNRGDIETKYILYISPDEKLKKNEEFWKGFEVWITNDLSDNASAVKMEEFEDTLAKDEISDVFYLVIKMKEDAGNGYQKQEYSGLGITVCAVQGNGPLIKE